MSAQFIVDRNHSNTTTPLVGAMESPLRSHMSSDFSPMGSSTRSNALQRALRKQSAKFHVDHAALVGYLASSRYKGGSISKDAVQRGLVRAGFAEDLRSGFVQRGEEIFVPVAGDEDAVGVMHLACSILGVYVETVAARVRNLHAVLAGKRGRTATFGHLRDALLPNQWHVVEEMVAPSARGEVVREELTVRQDV